LIECISRHFGLKINLANEIRIFVETDQQQRRRI